MHVLYHDFLSGLLLCGSLLGGYTVDSLEERLRAFRKFVFRRALIQALRLWHVEGELERVRVS